jgi:hypothetical protein
MSLKVVVEQEADKRQQTGNYGYEREYADPLPRGCLS